MKRRKPWLAFCLTQLCPGLGQLYNNDIPWFLYSVVISVAMTVFGTYFYYDTLQKIIFMFVAGLVVDLVLSVQAWLKARQVKEIQLKKYNQWWIYILFVVVMYGLPDGYGQIIRAKIRSFQIPSESMVPNLLIGDRLVADGWAYSFSEPKRGDVIVFDYPRDHDLKFVKRLIGLPGDTVEVRNGELYLNGKIVPQSKVMAPVGSDAKMFMENLEGVEHTMQRLSPMNQEPYGPKVVPPGMYFMMGDNRDRSSDSRVWGYVKREEIIGRMLYIFFSWDTNAFNKMREEEPADLMAALKAGLRWDRIGLQIK